MPTATPRPIPSSVVLTLERIDDLWAARVARTGEVGVSGLAAVAWALQAAFGPRDELTEVVGLFELMA